MMETKHKPPTRNLPKNSQHAKKLTQPTKIAVANSTRKRNEATPAEESLEASKFTPP
jgi:hypothetical protein